MPTQLIDAAGQYYDADNPLSVRSRGAPVRALALTVPGVVASAAYASGDAVGTRMDFVLDSYPWSGILVAARLLDMDKELLAADVVLFNSPFTATADNSPFDPPDSEAEGIIGVLSFAGGDFFGFSDWGVGYRNNLAIPLLLPGGALYCQMVTRGAPNLTAATDYRLTLFVVSD